MCAGLGLQILQQLGGINTVMVRPDNTRLICAAVNLWDLASTNSKAYSVRDVRCLCCALCINFGTPAVWTLRVKLQCCAAAPHCGKPVLQAQHVPSGILLCRLINMQEASIPAHDSIHYGDSICELLHASNNTTAQFYA